MQNLKRIFSLAVASAAATAVLLFAGSSSNEPELSFTNSQTKTLAAVAAGPILEAGEALVGNVATAPKPAVSLGSVDAPKYQWFACDDEVREASAKLDDSCAQIAGAVSAQLRFGEDQIGKRVLVAMSVGSGPITFSAATEAAVSPAPTLSATPLGPSKSLVFVSATSTRLNSKITVARGAWPAPVGAYVLTYKWLRCAAFSEASITAPANCAPIAGAAAASYTVTARERGFWIISHVTATLDGVTSEIWTKAIGPAYKPIKYYKGAAVGAGAGSYPFLLGEPVTANEGTWDGPPKFTYQWHVCTRVVPASTKLSPFCKVITGASKRAFTPTALQNGKYLMVRVSGSTPLAKTVVTTFSASSTKVLDDPSNTRVVALPETAPVVGDPFTLTPGVWTGFPAPTKTYQWYVCPTNENASEGELPEGDQQRRFQLVPQPNQLANSLASGF
jgi:hypothetical protein